MSFLGELRRRSVFKVGAAYLIVAWLIAQIVSVLNEPLNLPEWFDTVVLLFLAIAFPIALFLAWAYELTPEGIKQTIDDSHNKEVSSTSEQRLNWLVTVLLVLAVAFLGFDRFILRTSSPGADGSALVTRVAILPCADSSPDPSGSFFAVGIHDELLNRLGSLQGLQVISRSSVMRYENARESIPEIAAALNVEAIMECTARYSGDEVVLTANLIDGQSDTNLWSDRYPANLSDIRIIFEIQADIAMNVANALAVEFLAGEIDELERLPTQSREAYELFLAAIAVRQQDGTMGGMQRIVALLNEALALDATYVEAWALLANSKTILSTGNLAAVDDAIAAAETVIELEPSNGAGYAELGFALSARDEWQTAEAAYQRALELGWPLAKMPTYSTHQLAVGHIEQAIDTLESNLEIDPMNSIALGFLMTAYETRGNVAKADELYERGRTLFGNWPWGRVLTVPLRLGRRDIAFLREEIRPLAEGMTAELLDAAGNPDSAREILLRYASDPATSAPAARIGIANWAAYLGDVELASEALRDAAVGSGILTRAAWEPLFRDVRSTPEFTNLIDELGLVEYWNETEWPEFCQQLSDGEVECR